jgi:hypothetical protein
VRLRSHRDHAVVSSDHGHRAGQPAGRTKLGVGLQQQEIRTRPVRSEHGGQQAGCPLPGSEGQRKSAYAILDIDHRRGNKIHQTSGLDQVEPGPHHRSCV